MRPVLWIAASALAASLLLMSAGCRGGNKAGIDSGRHTIVLTFASQIRGGPPDQLIALANRVTSLSGGAMRIDFKSNWRAGDPDQESDTIEDVRAGRVDLAWVGARAWDSVGVHSFDPLVAPFLIDSYPLERRVFASGMPRRMLNGVAHAGVVGVGILPGPMRKALGVRRRLVTPADFHGLLFGVTGRIAAQTLTALGAIPRQMFAQEPLGKLGGVDSQMSGIVGNRYDTKARYLSANLNLWPRPLVIIASPRVLRSLSDEQRRTLHEAAAAAVPDAMAASRQEDADAVRSLCARHHVALVNLTPSQLTRLAVAVKPVYRRLLRDPATRRAIRMIRALRSAMPPAPTIGCAPEPTATAAAASPIDGSWRMAVDRGDLIHNPAYGHPPTGLDVTLDAGKYRLRMNRGRYQFNLRGGSGSSHDTGSYSVSGGIVTFRIASGHDVGETWAYRWSVYRNQLTFSRAPPGVPHGPPNLMFAPWSRLKSPPATAPSASAPGDKLNGVYEMDSTAAESDPRTGPVVPENWGHWVFVFEGSRLAFSQQDSGACTWAYGRVRVRPRIFSWTIIDGGYTRSPNRSYNKPGEAFEFGWSRYRDTLTLSPVPGAVSPANFRVQPWRRLSPQPSRRYFSKECPPPKRALLP
ncbi:MAG: TRAP transporter substrate-binding protein [Gaiellaceae bacterium]